MDTSPPLGPCQAVDDRETGHTLTNVHTHARLRKPGQHVLFSARFRLATLQTTPHKPSSLLHLFQVLHPESIQRPGASDHSSKPRTEKQQRNVAHVRPGTGTSSTSSSGQLYGPVARRDHSIRLRSSSAFKSTCIRATEQKRPQRSSPGARGCTEEPANGQGRFRACLSRYPAHSWGRILFRREAPNALLGRERAPPSPLWTGPLAHRALIIRFVGTNPRRSPLLPAHVGRSKKRATNTKNVFSRLGLSLSSFQSLQESSLVAVLLLSHPATLLDRHRLRRFVRREEIDSRRVTCELEPTWQVKQTTGRQVR